MTSILAIAQRGFAAASDDFHQATAMSSAGYLMSGWAKKAFVVLSSTRMPSGDVIGASMPNCECLTRSAATRLRGVIRSGRSQKRNA
jgi:hypothetical protein